MKKRKKLGRKLLSWLLTLAMVIGMMPGMGLTALADGTTYNPASAYTDYAALNTNNTVVTIDEVANVEWYVIGYDSEAKTVTLLSKTSFGKKAFNSNRDNGNNYANSEIKTFVEGLTGDGQPLAGIKNALADIRVTGDPSISGAVPYLLSTTEANNALDDTKKGSDTSWWLRSPVNNDARFAACVYYGVVYDNGRAVSNKYAVRPALQLNLESVIFDSESNTFTVGAATVDVTSVTLNPSAAQTIDVGGTVSFTATVEPNNATDKKVKWSTSGSGVKLYTDEACNTEVGTDATSTLTVYAKGESAGSATVTCTSNADNTKSASCDVTVNEATAQYYVVGSMTDWSVEDSYLMTYDQANAEFQLLGVSFSANDEIKVVKTEDSSLTWYPEGMDNGYTITAGGTYNIHFRPDGQGDDGWHKGYIMVEAASAATYYASYVNTTTVMFNNIDWYIIADDSTAVDAGTVTLLAKDPISASKFHDSSNAYSSSTVKTYLDSLTATGGSFEAVAGAITPVTLTIYKYGSTTEVAETIQNAKLWLLSTSEAQNLPENIRKCSQATGASRNYWWLRSAGSRGNRAACVGGDSGDVYDAGTDVSREFGVRPALKLNLESVSFSSNTFTVGSTTVDVTGVSLDKTTAQTIDVDGTVSFTATVAPDNATDKKVKWSVGGTNSGAVKLCTDADCTTEVGADATETLTVYAKGESAGSATVTCTSNADSEKTASCDVTVNAPVTKYLLWVGGVQVTSANAADVFSDGKVSYAPATTGDNPTPATLTLNGYTYSGEGHREKTYPDSPLSAIYYSGTDPLTLQLSGTNSITRTGKTSVPSSEEAYGIHSTNCDLTIDGNNSGSLTVTGGELNTTFGIYAKKVTIKNADVTAKGIGSSKGTGIHGRQGVTIQNAVVNAEGKIEGISSTNNGFTEILGNSSVTATGSNKAINGTVKNAIAGTGWTDKEGTEGKAAIAVSTEGQSLSYKKVQFPAVKDTATVTKAPTAKTLTYNGEAQELVTTGEAEGGEMHYALGEDATTAPADDLYDTSIPTATDAGAYYVWYKGVGDGNHNDSTPACITVTINKKALTITADSAAKVYDATALTKNTYTNTDLATGDGIESVTITGTQTAVGNSANVPSSAVVRNGGTDVTANYEITYVNGTLTVTQATTNTVTVDITGWTYGDSANAPTSGASFGANTVTYSYSDAQDGTYTATVPTNAGTWYVKASVAGTDNYAAGEATKSFTIAKRELVISNIVAEDKDYDGNNVATLDFSYVIFGNSVPSDAGKLTVTATGTFDNEKVGKGKTVTIAGLTLGGEAASNYVLATEGQQTAAIADVSEMTDSADGTTAFVAKVKDFTGQDRQPAVTGLNLTLATSLCTPAEFAAYGMGAKLELSLEISKAGALMTDDVVTMVTNALKNDKGVKLDGAAYYDVSLYKKVGAGPAVKVTDLNGSPIAVTFDVPEDMHNHKWENKRTYYVVRIHAGAAQVIAETTDLSVTFSTDKFSVYALCYADKRVVSYDNSSASSATAQATVVAPKTYGVSASEKLLVLFGTAAAAVGIVTGAYAFRRRKEEEE